MSSSDVVILSSTEGSSSASKSSSESSFVLVSMDSVSSLDDTYSLPFISRQLPASFQSYTYTSRKRNICRLWRSLSRFQRSILSAFFVLAFCSCLLLYLSYSKLKVAETAEPQHRKEQLQLSSRHPPPSPMAIMDNEEYEKKAIFPAPTLPKTKEGLPIESAYEVQKAQAQQRGEKDQVAEPNMPKFRGPQNDRQKAVVAAFRHAWKGYKELAWGKDHLRPVSKTGHQWYGLGLTIVDSLDTMIIMGLDEEFDEARKWVSEKLNFDQNMHVNLFETTIRVLGGLLSAFHLSGDKLFADKAKDLGSRLIGAFESPSKIPYSDINLKTKKGRLPGWGTQSSLSEISSLQLEFRDLSRVTGNPLFEQLAFNVSQHIHKLGCSKMEGLCPMFMNPKTGRWQQGFTITLGARSDSYYEYLLKQWLQTGKKIDWLKEDYDKAMSSMFKRLVRYSEPNKLTFVGELVSEKNFSPKMDHLVCFISGTLALGAANGLPKEHMDYAKQIGHTCAQMYNNPTGLGPEIAHFNMILTPQKQDIFIKPLDAHSLLRPEAIEAWFYLYRLGGGGQIYQDLGWKAFQAIEKHAKVANGYSSVQNVKRIPVTHKDHMESFFLAETLKYLYLLLADDQTILPLTDYVFNTEAHPLPIRSE